MRATYEDLLRVARRIAVEAAKSTYKNRSEAVDDWRAVVAATTNHLRWLRHDLRAARLYGEPVEQSRGPLGRLARAIGAGGDLLASQSAVNARALDHPASLTSARAEVAAVALIGADAAMSHTRSKTPERRRLAKSMSELEKLAQSNVHRVGLGNLGRLSVGGPAVADDSISVISRLAARWERADDTIALDTLLTRDLRAGTAQLRTACGYAWHLTDMLVASPTADLDQRQVLDLKVLKQALRAGEAGALRAAQSWRRRLSDLNGFTGTPSEAAFLDLRAALDRVVRPEGRLLEPGTLVPERLAAYRLLDAVDELVWSAEQVGRRQQQAVSALVAQGRLFVPREDLISIDRRYLRPPAEARLMHMRWLRTNQPAFFAELTLSLAWSVDHLAVASGIARRLAGTSHESRPDRSSSPRRPAPYLEIPEAAAPEPRPDDPERWYDR